MPEILSMTGYGSGKGIINGQEITVELRSVNNRYLDCSVRLPRNLMFAEEAVKKTLSNFVSRGKVDVFVSMSSASASDVTVTVNDSLARAYFDAINHISDTLQIDSGVTAMNIAKFPDVLVSDKKEMDKDEALLSIRTAVESAAAEFNAMRAREGANLSADLQEKLLIIEKYVSQVEMLSPKTVEQYRTRLEQKLHEILQDKNIEEARIITEAAIFADKVAVDEETVRLKSHISQFRTLLRDGSPIGRKLDFLIQEFNRETNTIGSKCNDSEIARIVVDMKSEIEKIREQVQNIE